MRLQKEPPISNSKIIAVFFALLDSLNEFDFFFEKEREKVKRNHCWKATCYALNYALQAIIILFPVISDY